MHQHGDVILSSSAINALHQTFPNAIIDAYIYQDTLPMLSGHPHISQFITYDRNWKKEPFIKRITKEIYTLIKIRQGSYDLVLNLTNGDRGAIVSLLCGCEYSYGIDSVGRGLMGKKYLYTKVAKPDLNAKHEVERLFDVLKEAGVKSKPGELSLNVPSESQNKILEMLNLEGIKPHQYVLLAPLSRLFYKCLSPKQMADLVKDLHKRGEKVVVTGSSLKKELDYVQDLKSHLDEVPLVDFSGKISLKELAALIQMSKCLISVDSVPVHISSALKIPIVALYGPTSPIEWGPWMNPYSRIVVAETTGLPFVLSNKDILEAFDSLKV